MASTALGLQVGSGYLEAAAGWHKATGAYGRAEGGIHVLPGLAVGAYGQVDRLGPSAGVIARYLFSLP